MTSKLKGIYGIETLECGCDIRRYAGGLNVISGCEQHKRKKYYVCPACGKEFNEKIKLKKHIWTHAN